MVTGGKKRQIKNEKRKMCHVTINIHSTGDCGLGLTQKGEVRPVSRPV